MIPTRPFEMFWPEIDDELSARAASRLGVVGAIVAAGWTAVEITYALATDDHLGLLRIWPSSYSNTVILVALAFGIYRMRRWAALLASVYVLLLQIFSPLGVGSWLGAFTPHVLILLSAASLFLIHGVRGTFAFWRFRRTSLTGAA
jgi:hypothetical protein